jgi:carbon-monoxide dehydrogenase large subunit
VAEASGWIGRAQRRREDLHLVRGAGRFVDNRSDPDMVHLVMVRSPLAHAVVLGVDAGAARRMPGVLAVLTADDLGPVRPMPVGRAEGSEVVSVPPPLLARERVRFQGEPVAAVVAESRAEAEDAAELVALELESLEVLVDPRAAVSGGVALHPEAPDNVLVRWRRTSGDVEGAFSRAARLIRARLSLPRLAAAPIETRGAVAQHDPRSDLLTLWLSSQDPHRPRAHLATVLGCEPERIRVIVEDVGGAFGSKGALATEAAVAALAAMRLGRPVKWIEDRAENFLAAHQGRGQWADAELAVDAGGRFLALRARVVADVGAYLCPTTAVVPVTSAMMMTGTYDLRAADVELLGVATNRVPTGPYRGAGRPEAAYVIERLVDLAARELGEDPVEIRRRNFIPPERFPYTTALGFRYDSGDYARALDRAWERFGGGSSRTRRAKGGPLVGTGIAVFVERAGAGLWETGEVEIGPDGTVVVRTGSTPHGQGHQTTFAQIAADALGVDAADVRVETGDTAVIPEGMGSYASRSVTVGGSAVLEAAREVRSIAIRSAASTLGVAIDEVTWAAGRARAGDRELTLAEIAAAAVADRGADREPSGGAGLAARRRFELPGPVFPFGAYVVGVRIDPDTGVLDVDRVVAVDDAGRIVNPLLAEGQVVGSTVQGFGEAILEEMVVDDAGQILTGTFVGYGIASAVEAPPVESEFLETLSPFDPLGAKGIGESGSIAMPAAVANAVADALAPLGIRHLDPPYTPEKLWRAIRDARGTNRPDGLPG